MNHVNNRDVGDPQQAKKGFTLVELLLVMTIIAVLLSVASVGINNIGKGQGLTAGLSLGEGMLTQARNLAINQNTTARVIIHSDMNDGIPEERERYRRMMMVVYKDTDTETGEEESGNDWIRVGQPVLLPSKVYFSPELSFADMRNGGLLPTDRHQLSSQPSDTHQCVYYEFNGQGICSTPGAGFVLENGPRPMNRERPIMGAAKSVGGFVVMRNGSTSMIRDINRIAVQTN
ncbi:prepilin-type N-terminal cleavage/methylation domain-containing protein [Verrucomicrobiaceae bacterium 227]